MGTVQHFSTEGLQPSERLDYWMAGSSAIGGAEITSVKEHSFHGAIVSRNLGSTKIFRIKTGPHRAAWTKKLIRQNEHALPLRLWFQQSGTTTIVRDGVERVIRPLEWFLTDGQHPYDTIHTEDSCKIAIQLPLLHLPKTERATIRHASGGYAMRSASSHMLFHCLESAVTGKDTENGPLENILGDLMIDLTRVILKEQFQDHSNPSMKELTQDRIRAFVNRNLSDPSLSVDMIAQSLKCSKRYIHKVFNEGQTISEYIWSQRLEECRSALARNDAAAPTLTQIAFNHGFSSSAHFSRTFRAKFGMTPTAYRIEMLAGGSHPDK